MLYNEVKTWTMDFGLDLNTSSASYDPESRVSSLTPLSFCFFTYKVAIIITYKVV